MPVALDVTDHAQVRDAVARAQALAGGPLDAVVNNAAYAVFGAQEEVPLDEVRAMLETNVFGPMAVVQAALPAMRAAGRGVIVNVSSSGVHMPIPLLGAYAASKRALNALTDALAVECRPFGVRVARVEPGVVDTDFPRAVRRTGPASRGEGPYAPLAAQVRAGFLAWRAVYRTSPEGVADVIVRAVIDPGAPAVQLVGEDAVARLGTDEEGVLAFLGAHWPRVPA